ncbi:hypothetical protein [Mesoterricola silvestris]|uniref:Uncharacterized protein n=1 Tax=Mesoterricola silvestris TaxID=2927979 RepID=A0AA48K8H9_9BACT|nr:hypothetical protein [Mesoterricola silvestris]BDU72934.1 hypothetical protein METEAL_21080 [Mesoterricola silvestris]
MNFKPYQETLHRDWTIQHTWKTSQDRPGPDGFDRVAVKGPHRIHQGEMAWAAFMATLDALDGVGRPEASTTPLRSHRRREDAPRPQEPPRPRRRRGTDSSLQSLFDGLS